MKIRINSYLLENPKIKKRTTLLSMSDIHGEARVLPKLLNLTREIEPDYVCIPGDFLDYNNEDCSTYFDWLKNVTNTCNVVQSYGNHDLADYSKLNHFQSSEKLKLVGEISDKHMLLSEQVQLKTVNDFLTFGAINMPFNWYEPLDHNMPNEDLKEFKSILEKLKMRLNSEKFNVILCHSPNGLIMNDKLVNLNSDANILFLSGHNHGGLTPNFIQELRKNNRGLIGPYRDFNRAACYGSFSSEGDSLIVSSGVTKISKSLLGDYNHYANMFFKPDIEYIVLEPAKTHKLTHLSRYIK